MAEYIDIDAQVVVTDTRGCEHETTVRHIFEMNKGVYTAADVVEKKTGKWISVTEKLPECEWGAEVGNIEWISCGMVFAGCFGRGGKYRDVYFRTWTDGTEGIDAKGADYWRAVTLPEPPKEET